MALKANERTFQNWIVGELNQLAQEEAFREVLEQATAEEGRRTGDTRQRRYYDAILWRNRLLEQAVCEVEFKQPGVAPDNPALVDAAVASRTNDRKLAAAVRTEMVRRLRLVTRSDLGLL
jgi:hypothetical protein